MGLEIEKRQRMSTEDNDDEVSSSSSSLPTINMLDDDCFTKILLYLPMKERMRVDRVCKRWQAVHLQPWSDIKELEFPGIVYPRKPIYVGTDGVRIAIIKLLSRCGRFLHKLKFDSRHASCSFDIIPTITEHCHNLRHLTLHLNYTSSKDMTSLFHNLHRLERFELFNLDENFVNESLKNISSDSIKELYLNTTECELYYFLGYTHMTQAAAMSIQSMKNLWKLELYGLSFDADELEPICLSESITYLSFRNCSFTEPINLIANMRRLKCLIITESTEVHNEFLKKLAENCTELEELNIDGCPAVTDIGIMALNALEKLTTLKINRVCKVTDYALSEFINLKVLQCKYCELVTNNGVIGLIRNAPRLEEIDLFATSISTEVLDVTFNVAVSRTNDLPLKVIIDSQLDLGLYRPSYMTLPLLIIETREPDFTRSVSHKGYTILLDRY